MTHFDSIQNIVNNIDIDDKNINLELELKNVKIDKTSFVLAVSEKNKKLSADIQHRLNDESFIYASLSLNTINSITDVTGSFSVGVKNAIELQTSFSSFYSDSINSIKDIPKLENIFTVLSKIQVEELAFTLESRNSFFLDSLYNLYLQDIKETAKTTLNESEAIVLVNRKLESKETKKLLKSNYGKVFRARLSKKCKFFKELSSLGVKYNKENILNLLKDKRSFDLSLIFESKHKDKSILKFVQLMTSGETLKIATELQKYFSMRIN